jgi:hypothetical protein
LVQGHKILSKNGHKNNAANLAQTLMPKPPENAYASHFETRISK